MLRTIWKFVEAMIQEVKRAIQPQKPQGAVVTAEGVTRYGIALKYGAGPQESLNGLRAMEEAHRREGCDLGREHCGFYRAEEDE